VLKLDKDKRLALILAPRGRDAAVIEQVLAPLETRFKRCANLTELTRCLCDAATMAIVTEEALRDEGLRSLQAWIEHQPPWSDFPFVVLASREATRRSPEALAGLGNDVLLERPLSADTLIKAVSAAMRSRRRQYEAREQLQQYEQIGLENRRLYESESRARSEAEAANRAKDEFLATLSHELRTPLSAILGWTYVLQQRRSELGDLARGIDTIQRNALSQARLIEDLLDMSRIVAGKVSLEVQTVVPAMAIDQVVASLLPTAQAKNIEIRTDLEAAMTPISGDAQRLQQVFRNLLVNALKFTPPGGRVEVRTAVREAQLLVTISDNGAGIAPDFLPHVFERFRQADGSTTRSQGGLGLGLAIVQRLVDLHGGTVSAASEGIGKGATFEVRLPLVGSDPSGTGTSAPMGDYPALASSQDAPIAGLQVLLVEDDPDGREMVERLLRDNGAQVTAVESAEHALWALRERDLDVMISDIAMPRVDGYELLARARQEGFGLPAVALTAFARPEDKARALEVGYSSHVSKPVEPMALINVVAAAARNRDIEVRAPGSHDGPHAVTSASRDQ